MRPFKLTILLCLLFFVAQSQIIDLSAGKTYALVIGISDYQQDSIPDLLFAHKDATLFSDYLKSSAGGSVPAEDIVLLTNEEATRAKVYQEWKKLLRKVAKDDKVIFYFSGHGDVEKETSFQLGFLLTHDTPFNNYMNNALSVDHLNIFAKEMSEKGAKTTFFLDACRSGKLAGSDFNGPSITFKNLSAPVGTEVRVMSCKSDQKSIEISTLGNGRGLFSYYLINGLTGKADGQLDDELNNQVSLEELAVYLKKNVRKVSSKFGKRQDPMIEGVDEFLLANIDKQALAALEADPDVDALVLSNPIINTAGVPNAIFAAPEREFLHESKVFLDTPFFNKLRNGELLDSNGKSAYDLYKEKLKANPNSALVKEMEDDLIVALQDRAQNAINAYLNGDQNELNKRLFVSKAVDYEKYPKYLAVAAELMGEDDVFYKDIQAKRYYFEGINKRLAVLQEAELNEEELKACIALQEKALSYSPNTAYIHNEIGVCKSYLKDNEGARNSYKKAIEISPSWAIPQSNLGSVDIREEKWDEAIVNTTKALEKQSDYLSALTNLTKVYEIKGNLLKVEELGRTSIKYHWFNHIGFANLAGVYAERGDFKLADHFYKEMEIRMQGLFPAIADRMDLLDSAMDAAAAVENSFRTEKELLAAIESNPLDFEAWEELGRVYLKERRLEESESCFLRVIEIVEEPLMVHQYLGDLYSTWERKEDAIDSYRKFKLINERRGNAYDFDVASNLLRLLEDTERFFETEVELHEFMDNNLYDGAYRMESFYDRMIERFPDNANYFYKRGLLTFDHHYILKGENETDYRYFDNKKWEDAVLLDFEKALTLNPDHPSKADIYLKNSQLYIQKAKDSETYFYVDDFLLSSDVSERERKLYFEILNHKNKAVENAIRSHLLNPNEFGPKNQLVTSYFADYKYDKGVELLESIQDSTELSYEQRKELAFAYIWSNRLEEARNLLNWAAQKPFAKEKEFYELMGMFFDQAGQYKLSIDYYLKALDTDKEDSNTMYKIATLHCQNDNNKKAMKWLNKAMKGGFEYLQVIHNDIDLAPLKEEQAFIDFKNEYGIKAYLQTD